MTRARLALGGHGEDRVARWYLEHGYEVIARNWRCKEGELDLVLSKAGTVVFCEVKTRSSDRFGTAADAVTYAKQRKLRRLAVVFLQQHRLAARSLRFDVGAIQGTTLDVIEDAF